MCVGVWVCGCVGVWVCGCVEYLYTYRVASTHDLNAILFPRSSEHTDRCIAV